jgi:hypothetical protein
VITAGAIARIVFAAVAFNCFFAPDNHWLGLHFVWGSPTVEVQAAGE